MNHHGPLLCEHRVSRGLRVDDGACRLLLVLVDRRCKGLVLVQQVLIGSLKLGVLLLGRLGLPRLEHLDVHARWRLVALLHALFKGATHARHEQHLRVATERVLVLLVVGASVDTVFLRGTDEFFIVRNYSQLLGLRIHVAGRRLACYRGCMRDCRACHALRHPIAGETRLL